jgi:uncharacterized peroxidase-related enzyme
MQNVPILKPEHAPRDVFAVYEDFHRRMSFPAPPNFIMTQGHSLAAARGTWGLVFNVLVAGEIPRWTKEIIFVAISKERNCKYCEAAHIACCRMLGVNAGMMDHLVRDVRGIEDDRLREMVLFALQCAQDPQSLTEENFSRLQDLGLKQSEIVELIAMAGLAVYANIMADATKLEPDDMFETVGAAPSSTELS